MKRFRFNASTLHREKICDRFEYPMQLDMKKYMSTKSDLVDEESCLYKLSGVVVHSGMVDAGHYYSFIKERNSLKEKWYRFDDRSITDFNPNDLPVETFGGDKTSSWYDPTTDPYRTRNVYMLFYEREKTKTPEEIGNGLQILKDSVPKDLLQSIRQENTSLLHERLHFDPYFLVFLREVVENLSVTETSECPEDDFVLQTLKHATNLFFETIVIERNEQSCLHWIDILSRHYLLHLPACKWILNTLCTTKTNWFCSYFLESNDTWLRESLKHFLETVLSVVSIREDHLLLDYCVSLPPQLDGVIPFEKWSNYDLQKLFLYTSNIAPEHVEKLKPYNVSDVHGWYKKNEISLKIEEIGLPQEISLKIQEGIKNALNKVEPKQIPTMPTLAKFTTYLFRIMEDTRNHWRRFQQYWSLLDFLTTKCGDTEKHYILEHHKLVTRLLDYYMGPYTLYKREDERVTLGVKGVTVDLSSFFWLLSHAICSCNNFAMQSGSRSFDMPPTLLTSYPSPLFNHDVEFLTNNELMGSFIRQCYNVNAIREMIKHLSWEDTEKSIYLLAAIQEFHAKIDTNSYIILLRSILELEDSLQPLRISILLTNKGKGLLHSSFFKEADEKAFQLLKLFLDLGKAKPLVASWLKKNGTLEQILIRYDDLFMRKRRESYKTFKIELLQTLEENNTPFPPISSPYEEIPSWTQ
uniref:USP domain-containing protein n=1 Tax=Arcella intermedia TaxID=1963864 RepID=A0A6B2KYT5_9EUKA